MSRRTPMDEIERWVDRMSSQLDEASRQWEELAPATGTDAGAVDLVDTGEAFDVTMELPGFDREEVEVRLADQTLSIEAEQTREFTSEDENYVRSERSSQSVSRQIRLPEPVDAEGVTATLEKGLLSLTIPKAEPESRGESIDIE